jgi:hypothetical protein
VAASRVGARVILCPKEKFRAVAIPLANKPLGVQSNVCLATVELSRIQYFFKKIRLSLTVDSLKKESRTV